MAIASELSDEQIRDREEMTRRFQRQLDPSRISDLLGTNCRSGFRQLNSPTCTLIGEGTHFRAYSMRCLEEPIVISVAKSSFLERERGMGCRRWLEAMQDLQSLRAPLIPPFRIFRATHSSDLALVTPFGEGSAESCHPRWHPISHWVEITKAILAHSSLQIDDVFQLRSQNGVPFIHDFSDLKFIGR